jgi:hypothetical protein
MIEDGLRIDKGVLKKSQYRKKSEISEGCLPGIEDDAADDLFIEFNESLWDDLLEV